MLGRLEASQDFNDGRLLRSYTDGRARHNGYLDDYAFLIEGLLDLYEATGELRWLTEAIALQKTLDEHYEDTDKGGYFVTSHDHEDLLAREKPTRDGAEPSGNSVALLNLLRLEEFTTNEAYRKQAEKGFAAFAGHLTRAGVGVTKLLTALDYYLDTPLEILIVEPEGGGDPEPLLGRLRTDFLPNRIVALSREGEPLQKASRVVALLDKKKAMNGQTTAYVCEKGFCELPTSDPEVFARQIDKTKPLFEEIEPRPLQIVDPEDQPQPWEYDPKTNRHWHPGHGHWHDGRPPQLGR